MAFVFRQKVLFKHCDPAGIVFYPRYFEMLNDAVEAFFDSVLHAPFEKLHRHGAVPTAQIEARFFAPSRHGDLLQVTLQCARLGKSSMALAFEAVCGSERRFDANSTLVHVDRGGNSADWPQPIRMKIQEQLQGGAM